MDGLHDHTLHGARKGYSAWVEEEMREWLKTKGYVGGLKGVSKECQIRLAQEWVSDFEKIEAKNPLIKIFNRYVREGNLAMKELKEYMDAVPEREKVLLDEAKHIRKSKGLAEAKRYLLKRGTRALLHALVISAVLEGYNQARASGDNENAALMAGLAEGVNPVPFVTVQQMRDEGRRIEAVIQAEVEPVVKQAADHIKARHDVMNALNGTE